MLSRNLYPEICISLLTISALKMSSKAGQCSPQTTRNIISIKCTPHTSNDPLVECHCHLSGEDNACKPECQREKWNFSCRKSTAHQTEVTCHKCDLKGNKQTICCDKANICECNTITAGALGRFTCTETTSSQSNQRRKSVSSSPALSPRSSSSMSSSVATLIAASSSSALSLAAEKLSPTSSSSILPSVQKLFSASSSQIVSSQTAWAPTTSSSIVSPAPTLSLKALSSIASVASRVATSLTPSSSLALSLAAEKLSPTSSSSILSSLQKLFSALPSQFQKLENDTISDFGSLNITGNNSLQAAANLFENFTTKHQNLYLEKGQGGVEKLRTESIFKVAAAFEKIVLSYGKYHLRETNRSKRISYPHRNMLLVIQKDYKQNASDFQLKNHEWQADINISSANFAENGSVIVVCVYKDLHILLQPHFDKTRHVLTRIIMAAMDPKPGKLQENVILKFKNLKIDTREKHCVFWSGLSNSQDGFSKDGCHLVTSQSNSEETVCSCSHLTHFAVLVDYSGGSVHVLSQKDEDILEIITYVGLSLSIIGMILTIITYSLFTDIHQPLTQIRLSLAASLGAGQISFLAGMHAMGNPAVCITAAVLTQYFLLAAFCWMLVEGIYFYLFIVKVYNISNKMIVYHVMAWGFPIIFVGIPLGVAIGKGGIQSYTSDKYCWLSSTNDLMWIFVAFLTATAVFSSFILARVIRELTTLPQTGTTKIQRVRLGIRTCVVMIPLLGITWSFGILSPLHKTFTYIFTILNSTQGFLIFTLHCVRNSQIMERLRGKRITKRAGQIRAHLRGRMNVVSPSPNKKNSAKKNAKIHPCDGDSVWAIKLHPFRKYELK